MNQVVVTSSGPSYLQQVKARGHSFLSDAGTSAGGQDQGPNPHELLLGALGACTAITLQMYAQRKKWDLQKVTVTVTEQLVADPANPGQKITQITDQIDVEGNLDATQVKGLEAAASKCPVYKLLTGSKLIVTSLTHTPPSPPAAPGSPPDPTAPSQT